MSETLEELTEKIVKESISLYLLNKKIDTTHVLDPIFPKERRVASIMQGLMTSFGTKVWEKLAAEYAQASGFKVFDQKQFNSSVPEIPKEVRHLISDFEVRKLANPKLSHETFYEEVKEYIKTNKIVPSKYKKIPKGTGIDLWIKVDDIEYLIDVKTTQINAGTGPKLNSNILSWYTYQAFRNEPPLTKCFIAFPFNPHKGDFWSKEAGKVEPLIPSDEARIADEFWGVVTNTPNPTDKILRVFNKIGSSNFPKQFDSIFYL